MGVFFHLIMLANLCVYIYIHIYCKDLASDDQELSVHGL